MFSSEKKTNLPSSKPTPLSVPPTGSAAEYIHTTEFFKPFLESTVVHLEDSCSLLALSGYLDSFDSCTTGFVQNTAAASTMKLTHQISSLC